MNDIDFEVHVWKDDGTMSFNLNSKLSGYDDKNDI